MSKDGEEAVIYIKPEDEIFLQVPCFYLFANVLFWALAADAF